MNNTLKISGILCLGVALFATLSSVEQNSTETAQVSYVQNPPIAKQYWVQKIRADGEYAVLLKARFEHDLQLPEALNIYKNGEVAHVMVDDGTYPDDRPNDGVFATIVHQDPANFANEVITRQNNIQTKGYNLKFTGHSGELIHYDQIRKFNVRNFEQFQVQELDANLIEGTTTCDMNDEIVKQNSLFITDLSVVEDPVRTYNPIADPTSGNAGNTQGAWTFGELMKNMAGGYADESSPTSVEITQVREFIKAWIVSLYSQFTVNNITSPAVNPVHVLKPIAKQWIEKTREDLSMSDTTLTYTDTESWKGLLDEFTTAQQMNAFLANAPFKLTAIVNRLDVRGNAGYDGSSGLGINAGETRFIFSLVQIIQNVNGGNTASNFGKPIQFYPTGTNGQGGNFMDWDGMNVILEYSNIAFSECETKELGQKWKDLSDYDLENPAQLSTYLTKLQEITDGVTTRNANPNGINGSAISQVRTNTKLFHNTNLIQYVRWNLREFTLNETTGYLENSPTRNNPTGNIRRNSKLDANQTQGASSEQVVDWVYDNLGRKTAVMAGNHNLPHNRLTPTSSISDEMQSYYALGFWHQDFPDNVYDDDNYNQAAAPDEKLIRHQLSLNSCSGCHAAETKTLFTMVRPLGYGQEADYWSATPSVTTGYINNASNTIDNAGRTFDPNHPDAISNGSDYIDNYNKSYYEGSYATESRTIPNVAPFLTGRNYRGTLLSLNERWEDDEEDQDSEDETNLDIGDKTTKGLFYVNDPSNEADVDHDPYYSPNSNWDDTPFPKLHDKKYGYNELENRLMDLCLLITEPCNSGGGNGEVFTLVSTIGFVPLPEHGH